MQGSADPLERRPFSREEVQVVNLEAALFWQEVSETQQRTNAASRAGTRVRPKAVGWARPAALSLVSANVLTLHQRTNSLIR